MVGALSVMGSVIDSHTRPSLCLDVKSGDLGFYRKNQYRRSGQLDLSSSFVDAWDEWRLSAKVLSGIVNSGGYRKKRKQRKSQSLVIVSELGGQYEDTFNDVKSQTLNYFTYKAVRTVLNQLYELNPTQYRWFYDFIVNNKPGDGKRFLRALVKEKQDLAERVMVTRLHLYGKWIKLVLERDEFPFFHQEPKCDHAAIYQEISDENLALMRERLMETVIWPSDDTNTEKIG